jgi:hypothetical protein
MALKVSTISTQFPALRDLKERRATLAPKVPQVP